MAEDNGAPQGGSGADTPPPDGGAEAPLNRAQRRALASGKKPAAGSTGGSFGAGGAGSMNRGSRPAGMGPRQSRASGRGK